jgi:DNA phosphorothioation-dependent restriction protein DptG
MEKIKIDFDGEDGVDKLFNEGRTHTQGNNLKMVPFTTNSNPFVFNDFTGVSGAFARLMDDKKIRLGIDISKFFAKLDDLITCSGESKEKLIEIIKDMYVKNNAIIPFNIRTIGYLESNSFTEKIAMFLFSMFIDDYIKGKYQDTCKKEEVNVLQKIVLEALPALKESGPVEETKYNCFLPYIKDVFQEDIKYMIENPRLLERNLKRFLEYYFMFYITQLAIKMSKFEKANLEEVEKVYMTLGWEVTSKTRQAYIYGWRYVFEYIPKLFSHAVTLELLSRNNSNNTMDYVQFYTIFNETEEDLQMSEAINQITEKYKAWISNVDYSRCIHEKEKDGNCITSNQIRLLFETIDFQFTNGTRTAPYQKYSGRFIEFVHCNFGKRRGALGYTFNITEQDIILFTKIILGQNDGRMRLVKLFNEFERRGLVFDRESKKKIVELFEKLNLLEKKSDSGDAQYVKSIL